MYENISMELFIFDVVAFNQKLSSRERINRKLRISASE